MLNIFAYPPHQRVPVSRFILLKMGPRIFLKRSCRCQRCFIEEHISLLLLRSDNALSNQKQRSSSFYCPEIILKNRTLDMHIPFGFKNTAHKGFSTENQLIGLKPSETNTSFFFLSFFWYKDVTKCL